MRRFITGKRLLAAALVVALCGWFWKPIVAHAARQVFRVTYPLRYPAGSVQMTTCFADADLLACGGRLGIDDLRRFADDPAISPQGRERARLNVMFYDSGLFARSWLRMDRDAADELRNRSRWYWLDWAYWGSRVRADYVEYITDGAP